MINLPILIGLRYIRAKRRNGFVSFISFISVAGIALGVWALITVISIMNGFGQELRGRILDVASHVTVSGQQQGLANWRSLIPSIEKHSDKVAGFAPYLDGQGLVRYQSQVSGVFVRGINPKYETDVSTIANNIVNGQLDTLAAGEYRIILGEGLASKIGAKLGEKITIITPQASSSVAGLMPRLRRFTVTGIFSVGMSEYDNNFALIHIQDAAKLYKTRQWISGVRLKLHDVYQAREFSQQLNDELGFGYFVDNWTGQHENFFRALEIERRVMFIILFLIVAVAAFNIVATLVMVVTDKQADIAILRTLGLSPNKIKAIFFVQGTLSGAIGTLIGAVLGVLTAVNIASIVRFIEKMLGFQLFPSDVYIISDFPAQLLWSDVGVIISVAVVLSMLATWYPAHRASKIQPAEALRYD